MKAWLTTLLLLVQLQPLLGTAVCLGLAARPGEQDCQMPDHRPLPGTSTAQSTSPAADCSQSLACAPSPLAVVSLPETPATMLALNSQLPITASTTLSSISSTPPFHPPKS
jgi:hypothetical protein